MMSFFSGDSWIVLFVRVSTSGKASSGLPTLPEIGSGAVSHLYSNYTCTCTVCTFPLPIQTKVCLSLDGDSVCGSPEHRGSSSPVGQDNWVQLTGGSPWYTVCSTVHGAKGLLMDTKGLLVDTKGLCQGFTGVCQGFTGVHQGFTGVHQGFTGGHQGFTDVHQGFTDVHQGFTGVHQGFVSGHSSVCLAISN